MEACSSHNHATASGLADAGSLPRRRQRRPLYRAAAAAAGLPARRPSLCCCHVKAGQTFLLIAAPVTLPAWKGPLGAPAVPEAAAYLSLSWCWGSLPHSLLRSPLRVPPSPTSLPPIAPPRPTLLSHCPASPGLLPLPLPCAAAWCCGWPSTLGSCRWSAPEVMGRCGCGTS